MRRNADDELRRLGRRARVTKDREDLQALALAQERADGAIDTLKQKLRAMITLDWEEGVKHEGLDDLDDFLAGTTTILWLAMSVVKQEGHYGMLSGRPGEGPGIADFMWDDRGADVLNTICVFDGERDMVTIGLRRASSEEEASINYMAWPDLACQRRAEGAGWWRAIVDEGRSPALWRRWSRVSYELAVTPEGPIHDRVRVPRAVIERWNLLEGQQP